MGDGTKRTGERRFRISRRVNTAPVEPYAEKAIREAGADDADKGTPEMNRTVEKGCSGCFKLTLLFLLIAVASIVTTCAIRK